MKTEEIQKVLKKIITLLGSESFRWSLGGSANLIVQGVKADAKDLDITTDEEGLECFRKLLEEYIIQDFYNNEIEANSLECEIGGIEVEINFYDNDALGMLDTVMMIKWEGIEVPVLPLPDAKKFYEKINRPEKVKLIEKFMKKK